MEYTQLGKSGIEVSRVCLGCLGFGDAAAGQHSWTVGEAETREIVKRALDLGVNFFDTAIAYQGGTSEQFLGRALHDFANRDEVVVATKFLPRSPGEIEAGVSGRDHLLRSLDTSLAHLGMDHVDLYIYHMWDWNTPYQEYLEALGEAHAAGKVRAVGIANCFAWQLAEANDYAEAHGLPKFASVQNHYNLIMREDEREMKVYCDEHNVAMTPYSALASGRLSRKPGETSRRLREDAYAKFKYDATADMDLPVIERVAEVAEGRGAAMAEVAIAWLLTKVASPVVGATKLHHVDAPAAACDLKLTDDELAYLEEPYAPHALSGVMAQNTPAARTQAHVWTKNGAYAEKKREDKE